MNRLLDLLAQEGKGIIVVSSDLKELLGLCDRIAVLSAGRLVKIFDRSSLPTFLGRQGITNFLKNGGTLEMAQRIAGYADSRTTKLY